MFQPLTSRLTLASRGRYGALGRTVVLAVLFLTGAGPAADGTGPTAAPDKTAVLQRRLADSLETWIRLKAGHGDHYRYEVRGGFLTFYDVTTITVRDGKVVARAYTYVERDAGDVWRFSDERSWTEAGAAVGGHEHVVAPRTVDELYAACRDDVLTQNPLANTVSLYTDGNGVLSSCTYL